ncbi:ABC transporter permease [Paracoccus versutus]|jgi:putative ABC transport system permease protein|uniref:ABC transport system permease protein n=1 Tax=Paracoccus versutus TaxID=34007 RepID=A0A3E0B9R6_PARVE|nr:MULTISPECIES: ABC transporter permease [Alphaproteobacteria]WGR59259.1 ABC transporter permease [Paracoccus ferrooxidans]CAD6630301.1 ABC transporter permease [Rhizobium sp. Khangiran2]SFY43702.1 putative ABC transport system permease protein [Paracoccus pantotrophus]KGJ04308.1 ABC transporter permease [Paracoccus versutus]REF68468.1 putative ABC transport system permease protein [Paracoccus versutus]
MNLALKDIRHGLFRFVLTCFGLGLLMTVVLAMIGIYNGLVSDALAVVKAPAADVWVVEAGTKGPFAEASSIPADTRDAVARMPGVAEAGAVNYQNLEAPHAGRTLRLYVVGYESGRPGGPQAIAEGRGIGAGHFELVADRKTGLLPGETIRLGRNRFTVVGLVEGAMNSGGDPAVYVTLADAMALQTELDPAAQRVQAARGAVSVKSASVAAIIARMSPGADVDLLTATVRQWKHLAAMTQAEQEELLLASVVDKARRQIGLFLGILLSVSAVVIALIIYTMTMEKLKQIATLKLIGAPDRTIIALIVQQALILGASGWGIGLMLILAVKDYFPRRVVLEPFNVMVLAGIIAAVCLLSSALGVRAAMKVDPATALGS